jgi:hypothetical protein
VLISVLTVSRYGPRRQFQTEVDTLAILTEKQGSADPVIVGIRLLPEGDEKMALQVNQQAPGEAGKDGATGASKVRSRTDAAREEVTRVETSASSRKKVAVRLYG